MNSTNQWGEASSNQLYVKPPPVPTSHAQPRRLDTTRRAASSGRELHTCARNYRCRSAWILESRPTDRRRSATDERRTVTGAEVGWTVVAGRLIERFLRGDEPISPPWWCFRVVEGFRPWGRFVFTPPEIVQVPHPFPLAQRNRPHLFHLQRFGGFDRGPGVPNLGRVYYIGQPAPTYSFAYKPLAEFPRPARGALDPTRRGISFRQEFSTH